jgi:glutamate N-acetyltransferase/amino-acid N-acetyltransferase
MFHERPIFPRGFRCASRNIGLKPTAKDLALFVSDVDAAAAAVFTRNQFPGAPVLLGRETIRGGRLRAIFANSKVSNVATGEQGLEFARLMAAEAAAEIDSTPDKVLVSSTGVIGVRLPIEIIEQGVRGMAAELCSDPIAGAEAIMTTDTHPKALSVSVGDATITWVAKGSGMIEPNMATMLAYVFTDAALDASTLDGMLRQAVDANVSTASTARSSASRFALMPQWTAAVRKPVGAVMPPSIGAMEVCRVEAIASAMKRRQWEALIARALERPDDGVLAAAPKLAAGVAVGDDLLGKPHVRND